MAYTHLFFDADGTLFDFNTSEKKALEKTLRTLCGTWRPELADLYHQVNKAAWKELEKKLITLDQLKVLRFERFMKQIDLKFNPAEVSRMYTGFLAQSDDLFPGALEILEKLYKKYSLVLVTNGITAVQRGRVKATDTEKYFKAIVISEEVGVAKPDPTFFKIASERSGNPAKDKILMIGDSMTSDIPGAFNYGIDSCLIVMPHKKVPEFAPDDRRPDYIIRNFDQLEEILR
ncbi:MAG: YjjG family noncanonical pyrimidine nucleotidase [Spirochaetia bacterium]|nr:YjjG family noncanonical pyrimidine nucleotidase [Spirochaetia bacterium]